MAMKLEETLLAFGEWLDSEGLLKTPARKDTRTYEDIAREFIEDWESTGTRATLTGRDPVVGGAAAEMLPLDEHIRNGL